MQLFSAPSPQAEISPADFAGRWYFCDDGWLGTLTLALTDGPALTGTFASERFGEEYRVTARAAELPHAIELVIHDYNWLPEQRYAGRLMTRSRSAIAGSSLWQDTPFGFFATRASYPLGRYRPGVVRGEDFVGSWTAYLDGELATVVLSFDPDSGTLHGSCTVGSDRFEVAGRPGGTVPHEVALTVRTGTDGEVAHLSGYLMSRPKNAVSGVLTVAGTRLGFIMIRYA